MSLDLPLEYSFVWNLCSCPGPGLRPFLGRIRASSNNRDPAAFLLHHLGQLSSPRSVFMGYPPSNPKVERGHGHGFGMT